MDSLAGATGWLNTPPMIPATWRKWLSRILLLAIICRAAILLYAEQAPERFNFPDSHRYVQVARNIAAGLGPIDSTDVRAGTDPAYPAILALGVKLGCESDTAIFRFARIVNAVLSVLSVALLALLGRRLVGDLAGLMAAAILAVDPILLYFNALVLTETLYILTLLVALTAIASRRGLPGMVLAGAAFGLGAMTRSTSFLLPFALVPIVWRFLPGGRRAGGVAILLAAFLVVLTPNIIRNAQLFGRFVPVRTGGGAGLMEALGPWADGAPGMDRIEYPPTPDDANESDRDAVYRRAAWRWVQENPGRTARLALTKLARTWSPMMSAPGHSSAAYQAVAILTVAPIYLLAITGIFIMRRRVFVLTLLLAPAAYFTLVHMILVGSVRYRVPVMPLLFLLAGVAIQYCFLRRAGSTAAHRGAGCI